MSFGRGFVSGGAGHADVEFRANTGQFKADVNEARQVYQRTTGQMSDAALRMAVAQEKLDRAIHKYGAESRQAKTATLAYRSEMRSLQGQVDRTGRELDQTRRTMDRTFRGALAGSGIFKSLRGSIAFASSAFLGGAGFIYALRSTINAAKEAQVVEGQLAAALNAVGIAYERNRQHIEETIRAQSRLASFDDEELTRSLITFVRRTEDVNEALRLNAIVTEVARGKNISLEAATSIVLKASLGQAGAVRRAGIEVEKTATATELLALLQEKYAGSAKAYGEDAEGAQERWNIALENTQEIIGDGLLPTLTDLLNEGSDWLDQLADSGELQRKVNEAVETGTAVGKGLAGTLRALRAGGEPVVRMLGGVENAVQAALILGVVYKSAKAVAAVRGLAVSFGLVGPAAARSAVAANLAMTSIGAGAVTATGRVAGLRASLLGLARIGPIAIPIALIVDSVTGGHGSRLIERAITDEATQRVGDLNPRRVGGVWVAEDGTPIADQGYWERLYRAGYINARGVRKRREIPRAAGIGGGAEGPARRDARRRQPRTILDIARPGSDLPFLRELRDRYQAQIDALEARKRLSEEQKQRLQELYASLASTQSRIDAVIEEGERKLETQRQQAAERQERVRQSARLRLGRVGVGGGGGGDAGRPGIGGGAGTGTGGRAGGAKGGGGLTEADIRRLHFQFLGDLQGALNQFGSNLQPGPDWSGGIHSQVTVQTALFHDLIREVRTLTSGVRHPGAKHARTELSAAYGGVGGI